MNVLAIGAHPDDVELGCGATLAKLAEKDHRVRSVVVTNGEAQRDAVWQNRCNEAREAQSVISGGVVFFLGLEERTVCQVSHALVEKIRTEIAAFKPHQLYCHSEHDRHQTHVAVAKACIIAAHLESVQTVLKFEVPSTVFPFNPTYYSDVTECMGAKLFALSCFKSQAQRYYMLPKAIEGLAAHRAYQMRLPGNDELDAAAEAFEIERMIV